MSTSWRLTAALCTLAALPALAALAPARAASAAAEERWTAVALGDSFMSGEGGRWLGNAAGRADGSGVPVELWNRTDRVVTEGRSADEIYGGSDYLSDGRTPGCHRSDISEITSTRGTSLAGAIIRTPVNLACSGADTKEILSGYTTAKKQRAQLADLEDVIRRDGDRVKLIVLSIGGKDVDLTGTMRKCTEKWIISEYCSTNTSVTGPVNDGLSTLSGKVTTIIQKIKAAFDGQSVRRAQIIVQSYPSPIPDPAAATQLDENSWGRWSEGGCPFYNKDLKWFSGVVMPAITQSLKNAAQSEDVHFMDVAEAFQGHELCNNSAHKTSYASGGGVYVPPHGQGRGARYYPRQDQSASEQQETFHPNVFGQQALGQCLNRMLTLIDRAAAPVSAKCTSGAGVAPNDVTLNLAG